MTSKESLITELQNELAIEKQRRTEMMESFKQQAVLFQIEK